MMESTNVEYLGFAFSGMLRANLMSHIQKEWIKNGMSREKGYKGPQGTEGLSYKS